nr:hypothetical protein [Tanacetum cinerariifolium]
ARRRPARGYVLAHLGSARHPEPRGTATNRPARRLAAPDAAPAHGGARPRLAGGGPLAGFARAVRHCGSRA